MRSRADVPRPFCSSGGNLGNGGTRTAMYTDSIGQRHGRRTADQGSGRDRAGGIHHAKQRRLDHVRQIPELTACDTRQIAPRRAGPQYTDRLR
jgi:hypothetical protein